MQMTAFVLQVLHYEYKLHICTPIFIIIIIVNLYSSIYSRMDRLMTLYEKKKSHWFLDFFLQFI